YTKKECDKTWRSINKDSRGAVTWGTVVAISEEHNPGWRERRKAQGKQSTAESATTTKIEPVDLWFNFDAPPLPRELLPKTIEDFAFAQGSLMGADPAGLAMAALVACAAAIPDHVMLQPKKHDTSWTESPRIWVALVGLPSTKKTPIISNAVKPIIRID